jgi:hypothetical protein
MPKTLRIPITNVCDGSDYSAQILVGSEQVIANVTATSLAQLVIYGTGGWLGPVVNTSMVLGQPGSIGQPAAVFDRSQGKGNGVISMAAIARRGLAQS